MPETTHKSRVLRWFLLSLLCVAQFLDIFNSSAFFAAIPTLARSLSLSDKNSVWLVSAYQVTFASFLLLSGRISDAYNPKLLFTGGVLVFGSLSLISGFLHNAIAFLLLRALIGIAAALTIPSALALTVEIYPGDSERASAIAIFGGCTAVGNILGLLIGAVLTQLSSWRVIFYLEASIAIPVAAAAFFCLPLLSVKANALEARRKLDWIGIPILTVGMILFTLAVTSASSKGWNSPLVIASLLVSACMMLIFAVWEFKFSGDAAALPKEMWHLPGFTVLTIIALLPILWWTVVFLGFTNLWQDTYSWRPISVAIHLLPIGVLGVFVMALSGKAYSARYRKWLLMSAIVLQIAGSLLLPFADNPSKYWPIIFPAFCLGTTGTALLFTQTNIAIIAAAPPELAGTAGAIFNTSLQQGSAIGVAIFNAIRSNVDRPWTTPYKGTAAGYWFLCSVCILELIVSSAFFPSSQPTKTGLVSLEVTHVETL